jgi:hypothetical protein
VDIAAILAELGLAETEPVELEPRTANGLEWSIYGFDKANIFGYRYALAQADDTTHTIAIAAPAATADVLMEGLLYPAIDAFVPGEGN